jgi:hypothetical protein
MASAPPCCHDHAPHLRHNQRKQTISAIMFAGKAKIWHKSGKAVRDPFVSSLRAAACDSWPEGHLYLPGYWLRSAASRCCGLSPVSLSRILFRGSSGNLVWARQKVAEPCRMRRF